ncbi:MAG: alpha/beta hydrolase [Acidobacteriota bacterium]
MLILFTVFVVAGLFALVGFLVWLTARLLRKPVRGRALLKSTGIAFLLFLPLLFFLISPLLLASLIANASTRPQDRELTATPADYGREYRDVQFPSRDGLTLSGWYLEGEDKRFAVILCHGLFRNRQEVLERACALNRSGYPALLFDFRSHGESEPKYVSLGYQERLDVLGACDFLRKTEKEDHPVLFGVSMGAVAAIHAAAELQSRPSAIIADSPFASLDETVARHVTLFLGLPAFPFANVFIWNLTRMSGFDGTRLNTEQALRGLQPVPILLLYGEHDPRMPESMARQLFKAIPHQSKQLVFLEGAGHAPYTSDPDRYLKTVLKFLD